MKITIEPTEDQSHIVSNDCLHNKVTIETPRDGLHISDAMEQVVKTLQAWGFHSDSIKEYLDEEFARKLGLEAVCSPQESENYHDSNSHS